MSLELKTNKTFTKLSIQRNFLKLFKETKLTS